MNLEERFLLLKSQLEMFLEEHPKHLCEKVDVEELAMKLLDSTSSFIIYHLCDIQNQSEDLIFWRRSNLIERHLRELSTLKSSRLSKLEEKLDIIRLSVQQQDELRTNDLEMILEIDRMVSVQMDFLIKQGIPGFWITQDEEEEKFHQRLLNQVYKLIVEIQQAK